MCLDMEGGIDGTIDLGVFILRGMFLGRELFGGLVIRLFSS